MSGRLLGIATLLTTSLIVYAQSKFVLSPSSAIKTRLDLYKGSDSERELALKKIFMEVGCTGPNLVEQVVPHRKEPNLICIMPGSTSGTIVVGAHFDHVSEGSGIVDNWSGASLLPSLFQSLMRTPRTHTFVFVGFTGEEDGETGSQFYVKHLPKDELSHIQLMVNLDTLGLGPTKVWGSRSEKTAVGLLIATAHATHLPLSGVDVDEVGESDEESFIRFHVCTVTIHSLTQETLPILHTPADSPSAIKFEDYYDSYHLLAAYLSVLDAQLTGRAPGCPTAEPR